MANVFIQDGTMTEIANAIRTKGGTTATLLPSEMAAAIGDIDTSNEPIVEDYLVQFIGYRGEVYQTGIYHTGDVVSFPNNPSHDGLIFQGWSSPVDFENNQVTVTNQDLTIGAMFITESGNTEIDIVLYEMSGSLDLTLVNITNFDLIDWGDGTTSTELGTHTYENYGSYTIIISGTNVELGMGIFNQDFEEQSQAPPPCAEVRLGNVVSIGAGCFYLCSFLTAVTIPENVNSIGEGAFVYATSLSALVLPSGITDLNSSFSHCISLLSVVIPKGVTNIGMGVFGECFTLTSITIPDSVISIGRLAFYGCYLLTSLIIPDSVTTIDDSAIVECPTLRSIRIPNGITTIYFEDLLFLTTASIPCGDFSLSGCPFLRFLTLHEGGTSIGQEQFNQVFLLTTITIPDSVTSIEERAFQECFSLKSITLPDSLTSIGDGAFAGCTSLKSITLPDSVTSIGEGAFSGCPLTSITLPDSLTSIGDYTFGSCPSLTSITIPDSVTSIGEGAFSTCYALKSITIPNSVTSIGDYAFQYSYTLISYDFTAYTSTDTVPTISAFVFSPESPSTKMYFRDQATLDNFANATNWAMYSFFMHVKEVTE